MFDENVGSATDADEQRVRNLLQSMQVHTNSSGSMKTVIQHKPTGECVPGSYQEKLFACLREEVTHDDDDDEMTASSIIKFLAKEDQLNSDDFYYYLAKVVLESLIAQIPHLKVFGGHAQDDNDLMAKCDFVFIVSKLLKCSSKDQYESIVAHFKSFSFFSL